VLIILISEINMNRDEIRVATIQFEPKQFEKERNVLELLRLVRRAASSGSKLIVTPEMGTTGYCWYTREEVAPFVETIPGPTTQRFAEVAEEFETHIVMGLPEIDAANGLYYNAAVLIGPEGVIGKHRKTHSYISEPKWSAPGDLGHQVFETSIGRIALLICMDIHFIETARLVALAGADVICHISNWLAERTPAPYWISRAFENDCYLIESNRWGLERTVQFSGGSCVISPEGKIETAIDDADGIGYAEVDLQNARLRKQSPDSFLADRRPDCYHELVQNSYLWNPLDFFGLYGHEPLPPGRKSRIGVGQFNPSPLFQDNLSKIEAAIKTAEAQGGADLILFPELSLSGPFTGSDNAQPLSGPAVAALTGLAIRHRTYLAAGFVECDDQKKLYNTVALVGPEGLTGFYRKIHLNATDKQWATAGERWKTFDLPVGRVGLLIGYDAIFPESTRILGLRGCDVVLCAGAQTAPVPSSHAGSKIRQNYPIPTGADPYHWHHYRVRAGENNVYFAFSNPVDHQKGYFGLSGVFAPDTFAFPRREAIVNTEEGVAILEIDTTNLGSSYPTNVVRRKDLVAMRQPIQYKALL
jgi:predicted amidohydrolase